MRIKNTIIPIYFIMVLFGCSKLPLSDTLNSPSGINASDGVFSDHIEITWSGIAGARKYILYRSESESGGFEKIGTFISESFSDYNVVLFQKYYYKVTSIGYDSSEGDPSEIDSGYTKDPSVKNKFNVSWAANRSRGVNQTGGGYKVYYSRDTSFSNSSVVNVPYVTGNLSPTTATLEFDYKQTGSGIFV